MEMIKETGIKDYHGTNRMFAIFLCSKCGNKKEMPKRYGDIAKSCGCKPNYIGKTINGFKIIKDYGGRRRAVLAECPICKNSKKILMQSIKGNKINSCGCNSIKATSEANTKHGLCNHRLYGIRQNIIDRCENKNNIAYDNYGARGISICEDWRNNFLSFYEWAVNNGYKDTLSIDRIDNDGNYEPSNCRWATKWVQARNTRVLQKNNTSGYRGVSLRRDNGSYCAKITVNLKSINIGHSECPIECAKMYDKFVHDNNLEHTTNFTRAELEDN